MFKLIFIISIACIIHATNAQEVVSQLSFEGVRGCDSQPASPSSASAPEAAVSNIISPRISKDRVQSRSASPKKTISPRRAREQFEETVNSWKVTQKEIIELERSLNTKKKESKQSKGYIEIFQNGNADDIAAWTAAKKKFKSSSGVRKNSHRSQDSVLRSSNSGKDHPPESSSLAETDEESLFPLLQLGVPQKRLSMKKSDHSSRSRSATLPGLDSTIAITDLERTAINHAAFSAALTRWETIQIEKGRLLSQLEAKRSQAKSIEAIITALIQSNRQFSEIWGAAHQEISVLIDQEKDSLRPKRKKNSKHYSQVLPSSSFSSTPESTTSFGEGYDFIDGVAKVRASSHPEFGASRRRLKVRSNEHMTLASQLKEFRETFKKLLEGKEILFDQLEKHYDETLKAAHQNFKVVTSHKEVDRQEAAIKMEKSIQFYDARMAEIAFYRTLLKRMK